MFLSFSETDAGNRPCCLCDAQANYQLNGIVNEFWICPRCGAYLITAEFRFRIKNLSQELKQQRYKISSVFRTASEGLEEFTSLPLHNQGEVESLLSISEPSVPDKMDRLLLLLSRLSAVPGREMRFDYENDFTLLRAHDGSELLFLIQALAGRNLLTFEELLSDGVVDLVLSAEGWSEVSRLQQTGSDSNDGFIAMWFSPDRKPFDMAISAAIESAGYNSVRIDRVEHVNRIDDEIIARIRTAKFLVADFTGQRNGVYFEAGFMLGLGRPVIWLCDKSELQDVHFDARQYNTIDYTSPEDLRQRLQYRIEAILGKGTAISR